MGIYRKVLRYGLKKQAEASQGSLARTADRLRILSSVLAAGFVVLPFFCGEAFAAGSIVRVDSDKNLMQSGRADIYAESVHGDVGLNRFKDFKVGNQELANLYFQQAKDSAAFNTLVNTVDSRIDINGTVNAIRDNKVGGNLYFLSKDGMIVGTSGVVNAGSLTVLAAENSFENAKAASEALQKQNWELSSKGTIDVSGTLNTATGIDLRAAYINVAKAKGSSFAPQLRTGMLFYTTVNTDGLVSNAAVKDGRLTATVDSSGNIVIADPNDADNAALKGDGSIKLQASATKKNAAQRFLNSDSLTNTVEAKVNIAEGAKLDAAGDVLVSAEATHDSNRNVVEILDIAAFAKADVKVDGELKGRNITVTANAVNSLDSKNLKSIYDGLDRTAEEITNAMGYKITVNDALADAIGSTLEDRGVFGKGGKYFDTVNNVIEQLYMPFGFANAEATISVGSAGKLTASENISVAANSSASNNFKVEIQPKLQQGDANKLKYFTGGFVYVDTDSKATVNIDGKLKAEKNLAVTAKAVDTSIGTMVVKPPRILDNGQGGDSKDDGSFYTGLAMAMNVQNSAAVVNLGTTGSAAKDKNNPLLKDGGALTVNAVNVNTLASTASITVKENTPLNTAINISSTQGKAVINDNAALEGAQVQLNSKHMLNKLSVTADSSIGPELSGSQWVVNTPQAKHGLDELRKFLSGVNEGPKVSAAAGPNIKKDKKTWDQYFNFGMSFGLALVDNEARTNIAAGVPITATGGNLALTAAVSIGDSQFATKNLLNAANRDDPLGVSAAIGVEDMHNTAEVNAAEDSGSELAAKGNINITANVDNSYQRVNKLVDAVKSGWESFYNYWSTGGKLEDDAASDAKAKVQQIETIVADILTMASKNSAEAFVKDKQFAMKSKSAMEILTELTGATELKNALENLLNASNYANMYVSASTDKPLMSKPDITTMITGTVGVQNLANNARVNIGAHKRLTAGADVALAASVTEQNALLAGKWQLIPDIFTNDAGQNGLGASVGVQNAANKSEVRVNNGVGISAGSGAVAMQTANDIINTSLVMGGAKTSSLGITGMVNYVGGSSAAETLVDDDVSLSAAKKLRLAAANDTVLTAVTGDFGYSQGSSVGVSTSVIDYNVKTLAQLRNLEGTDSAGKGSITASALDVNAHTDGIINNFALAGVASKSSNANKDAGGVSTSTSDGKAKEGVEKAEVKAEEKKDDTSAGGNDKNDDKVQGTLRAGGDKKNDSKKLEESVIKVDAAGSVAWNYVKDETDASIDNVQIELLRPAGTDKTTSVAIAAEDSSYIGAYSGSAALSKFGFAGEEASSTKFEGMLSGAIAVNDVHKSTTSALRRAELNNADNVTNLAQNSGAQAAAGLAMGVELGKQTAGSVEGKSLSITAENAGKVKDEIEAGVTVGVISIHGSSAESRALGAADVYVGAGSSLRADSAELQAKIGRDSDYTTEAINNAVSVSAGLDVTVNRALTENAMQSNVYLGDISADSKLAALRVQALNNNSSNAYVYSFGLGIIAGSGNNFAKAEENSTVAISLDGGKGLTLQQLDVLAENVQSVTAKADGSASAMLEISPYTAKATHDAKAQTSVTLKGELTAADSMSVQALRRENTNLKADALTNSLAGGGDASADNKSTGKAFVEASAAKLTSGSDMLLKADNNVKLNRAEGYNEMLWGQGYSDLVGVNTAGVDNSITAETAVRLKDSSLQSKKGHVQLASQSEEDLLVNAYVYSSGIIDATETRVTNNINNDNRIELTNSNIKTSTAYKDITLAAADDLKLYTSAIAETPIGVLAGSNAVVKNALQRTNALGLYGAGELYSMNDINYYAGKHLDGSLGRIELDAQAINYNGSVIPVVLSPSLNNEVTQQNELFMQSGASNSVRHTNIYADAGEELVFVHTGRDTSYGGDEEGGYVTEDTGSKHYNKLDKNSVDINGSMAAGMDNRINIVVGAAGDIALFDEDERKSLTNKTALSKEELQGKITVAGSEVLDAQGKPTGANSGLTEETAATIKDSIKLGSVDYAQTLMNRYNEIMLLISEYASDGADSASYIGYKAEAERLLSQMEKMGEVSYVDGKYVLNARKMVDYVEIPELTASGGNIAINTSVLKSSKATGSLAANGSPEINVTNNTNLMLRLQRINVDDGGGRLLYNNEQLTGSTSSDFNNNISKLNKKANAASGGFQSVKSETGIGGSINIKGNYSGAPLDYRVVEDGKASYGQYLPQADIIVSGDVYNKNGSIKITSQNNNITIAGASAQDSVSVLGASVALSAGGSITQTFTDGIVNIDHDPRQFFNKQYDKLKKDKENIYDITGPNGVPYDGMEPTGSFIAGGVISINATDINVDGIVQSGYGDYGLWMSNDKNVEAAINKIKSSYKEGDKLTDDYVKGNDAYRIVKGSAYWDYDAKCYKYRIGAYYNPASNTIILEDVNASGGQIYLTGRISSIGAGRLYCLDGTSNITIESNLPYNMKLGSLITNDVKGRVSITDTAGYSVSYNNKKIPVARVTEYTNGMMETYYVSSGGTKYEYMANYFDGDKGGEYKPKAGLRYTWTSGTKNTDYKRYTHDDMDGGWGLWDLEEKDKDLQEWSTQENLTGSGSSANEARKDGVVVQETNDTRKTFMEYEHNQLGEAVRTIESERYYSTGLFGCHKHHEVTWKEETGSTDTYFASAKADYPIEVKFLGQKAEESAVKVHNVMGGIEMSGSIGNTQLYEGTDAAGNITHNTKGTVLINSGRIDVGEPVKQSGGALYGRIISVAGTGNLENINIAAGDDVYLKLKSWSQAGGEVTVNVSNLAGAKGRLHLDANSGELSESGYRWKLLDITNSSSNGDIIYAGNNAIEADRINLTAANGSIYGDGSDGSAMKIKAGQNAAGDDSLSASINVKAKGDINIEQVEGNLRLGRVYSSTGDVTLKSAGSIIDALPEEAAAKGSEESRLQRWKNIGLIEGGNSRLQEIKSRLNQEKGLGSYAAWDKTALLYAVSESILQKTAESLDQTSTKDPNVIGRNITLTANGSVGQRGETKEITLTGILAKNADGSYKNANALNDLKTLGQADVTNVTLRKAADGKQIAVIDETQTLGIQQTTSNGQGKINIQAAAKGGQGDIFLQGREEVSLEKNFAGRASKDLNIETLMTGNGRATVTSLGSINKLAAEPEAVNIQAQSLYLTAINGVGSTGALNVSLYGQDEANDGLSVIAGGAVAINQLGDKQLVLQHLSTGKDAGSYLKILADNDIVLHGDAPDSESITLQSRGGSITAGELTGNDITLSARRGSLDIDRLEAQGLLRAEAERMHFGDASIGHGSIRPGKEAVFDRLRTNGLAQFHNVSQYQVYDLGDGLQLRLTAGGRSPYDALVQFGNALHEFYSQRLYATGVLEKKLEYDVHEKLFGPQIRPGILFDRYNLIEQEEAEEKKI